MNSGEFEFSGDPPSHLFFTCPLGHGRCAVPIKPGHPKGWEWDGNRSAPTLSPSIHCLTLYAGKPCGWHGFIHAGVLVKA